MHISRRSILPLGACAIGMALVTLVGGLPGQTLSVAKRSDHAVSVKAAAGPFAWPWQIRFDHIERAMAQGDYAIEQQRRILDQQDPRAPQGRWVEVSERLIHRGPDEDQGQSASFDLQFVKLTSAGVLSQRQYSLIAAMYQQRAALLFHHQNFNVIDVAKANQNYAIQFAGIGSRAGRPVYVVAVYSRLGPRSGWLLGLDVETGYPLYRGEYDDASQLVAEVIVTKFDPNFRGSVPAQSVMVGVQHFATPQAALTAAGLPSVVIPSAAVFPPGYQIGDSKVVTDAFTGATKLVMTYTDGLDEYFVNVSTEIVGTQVAGDSLQIYHDAAGVTQSSFVNKGRQYVLIGRRDLALRQVTYTYFSEVAK